MMPLRGSRSGSSYSLHQQSQPQTPSQLSQQDPFASSSDVTLDDLTANSQQRDIFTHSSVKGKGAEAISSFATTPSANPQWLKVVTSYGYTFIKSDELHLLEGNADVQMVIEANNTQNNEVPASRQPADALS